MARRPPSPVHWVLSTVAATAAAYFTWLFLTLATIGVLRLLGLSDTAGVGQAAALILPSGASGAAFVALGNGLAPRHVPWVHVLLLMAILAGLVFLGVLAPPAGDLLYSAGATVMGALVAMVVVRRRRGS